LPLGLRGMDAPINEFDVSAEKVDGVRVVRVTGELDLATHERLGEQLTKAANGKEPIVVDLSSCDFIDSSGVRALLLGVREAGERFSIAAPGPQVKRILEMTGLEKTVPVHRSLDDALKNSQ
jgi:anti-sigma B factor antagonist